MVDLDGSTLVTEPSAEHLNSRHRLDNESVRENCLPWLLVFGRRPKKGEGYAYETVKARAYRLNAFYRYVREINGGYTADVTHDHTDSRMRDSVLTKFHPARYADVLKVR